MRTLSEFCCQNSSCPEYGKRARENLRWGAWSGKKKRIRMLLCKTCRTSFSERKGTPLFQSHLPEAEAMAIFAHLSDGCGIRQTGRLTGHGKDTVQRYAKKVGPHGKALHDERVAFSPPNDRGAVRRALGLRRQKGGAVSLDERDQGDNWDHVALDPGSRLVVSFVPGKRTKANVERLVEDFHRRTEGRPMFITSDEYKPYREAILRAYGEEFTPPRPHGPGRPPKARLVAPPGLVYATVHKTRQNGRVVDVRPHLVFGTAQELQRTLETSAVSQRVNTAFVERENGTSRLFNARKARKTYQFSKDWDIHEGMSWFEVGVYNFCWAVETLTDGVPGGTRTKRSPAQAAGLTDHVWTLQEWVKFPAVLPLDSS
jgi:IS1 family transposase